jgi:hypothetical protein
MGIKKTLAILVLAGAAAFSADGCNANNGIMSREMFAQHAGYFENSEREVLKSVKIFANLDKEDMYKQKSGEYYLLGTRIFASKEKVDVIFGNSTPITKSFSYNESGKGKRDIMILNDNIVVIYDNSIGGWRRGCYNRNGSRLSELLFDESADMERVNEYIELSKKIVQKFSD